MDWLNYILSAVTLIAGGGWFVNYKAKKMQAEADGWESQQRVYKNTIKDLEESCEYIRSDRDLLRMENEELRKENRELHNKICELEKTILEIRKEMARQGRRIETLMCKSKKKEKHIVDNNKKES